jgi:hypothetical protein
MSIFSKTVPMTVITFHEVYWIISLYKTALCGIFRKITVCVLGARTWNIAGKSKPPLPVGWISLFFVIQYPTMVYRATVNVVFKSRISQHLIEPKSSSPCPQKPATVPYLQPDESSPTNPFYFSKLNLLLSSHLRPALPIGVFTSAYPMRTLYTFIFSPMRATYMGKHAARMEELRKAHKILIGYTEATRLLRTRLRYKENMKMDFRNTGCLGAG